MEIQEFLDENLDLKLLKWTEIILQEDKANKLDAMYILVKDNLYCDIIFVDSRGNKRKIQNLSKESLELDFPKIDLSNMSEDNLALWKSVFGAGDLEYNTDFFNTI